MLKQAISERLHALRGINPLLNISGIDQKIRAYYFVYHMSFLQYFNSENQKVFFAQKGNYVTGGG